MSDDWIDVAYIGDIAEDSCKLLDLDDEDIAIYNLGGEYHAIEDRCSHDGGDLASGWVEDRCAVCLRHGVGFDIRTGKGMAPPACEDIHAFPTCIPGNRIRVRDDRSGAPGRR